MYTLLVFLFKDVDFPQVAVWVHFALMQKEKGQIITKINVLKICCSVLVFLCGFVKDTKGTRHKGKE